MIIYVYDPHGQGNSTRGRERERQMKQPVVMVMLFFKIIFGLLRMSVVNERNAPTFDSWAWVVGKGMMDIKLMVR